VFVVSTDKAAIVRREHRPATFPTRKWLVALATVGNPDQQPKTEDEAKAH
jgi:hypothetical protein